MEQNTNRMWWTVGLIVLGGLLISGFVMIANTNVMPRISEKANALIKTTDPDVTHTAYSWSEDGNDRFTTTKPNLNLINFKSGLKVGQFLTWADGLSIQSIPARAVFDYISVIPGTTYTINSNWDKTGQIVVYAYDSNDGKNATFIYDRSSAKWVSPSVIGRSIIQKTTISIPDGMNFIRVEFIAKDASVILTLQDMLDAKTKVEQGSTATPYMPSASEVKASDQPKYIGTYTDKSEVASQDPAKYTWKLNPDYHV